MKERFIEKRLSFKAPVLVAAAAAFVILFSAGIYFAANSNGDVLPEIPVVSGQVDADTTNSIVSVRATDSAPAAMSLQDLTIEEILQLLDNRGFEVDLRLKSVEPLTVSLPVIETSADVKEDDPEDIPEDIYYDQNGNQLTVEEVAIAEVLYDAEGNIISLETLEVAPEEVVSEDPVSENPPEGNPAAP